MPSRRDFLKMAGIGLMLAPEILKGEARGGVRLPMVGYDSRKCLGCQACVLACQNARGLSPETRLIEITISEKGRYPEVKPEFRLRVMGCDFCIMKLGEGEVPTCVRVCPTGALSLKDSYKIKPGNLPLSGTERVVHTVCLACNARCGLRVRLKGEEIIAMEGNPYHPYNRSGKPIPYETPVKESLSEAASTCGKPQCDRDYLKNPYRILVPLKRNGPRGSGRFVPISWEALIREIAEGGKLFAHLGDERHYPGLKEILSDEPLDPSAPELGPRRNQLVWLTGRSQAGRKHFINRFVKQAVGSVNHIGHTDICGIGFRMGNYILTDGRQVELKADLKNCRYMLAFGANLFAAGQPGVNTAGAIIARRAAAGELKVVIVDPRGHEGLVAAHEWLPVKPGEDGALALGLLRVLLEEDLYDREFLALPGKEAAAQAGRNLFTNATHLVITDERHPLYGKILRVKHLAGVSGKAEDPVVVCAKTGKLSSASAARRGELEWAGEVRLEDGSRVQAKTAFLIFKEAVFEHTLDYYAERSGISREKIVKIAREFAGHAPQAAAFAYHGGGNYLGGAYASYAIALLNALVGSVNRRGGYLPSGGAAADWRKGLYDLKDFPGALKPRGVKISREKYAYERTSEFKRRGYPAPLPWFPFTKGGLSVSAMVGIDRQYPYPVKILFTYFFNPVYSMPGGKRFESTLADPEKVPLHVSIDVTINETNIYADYIVPDVTYLEGHYGFLSPHAPGERFTAVRTPVVEPLTGRTRDGRPFSLETFLIDLAEYLGLSGFGNKAIPGGDGRLYPLHRAEDFYLRGIANLAENAGVPPAAEEERRYVEANYLVSRHRDLLKPQEWARCCTVLARGGVFFPSKMLFDQEGNFKKGLPYVLFWNEKLASCGDGLSGRHFHGTVCYRPVSIRGQEGFPFVLLSHKLALHTQSRTICYRQALALFPEPPLLVNRMDAERLGLSDGDRVRLTSASYPEGVIVRIMVSERIRPGCVALPHHYGHWQHGASKLQVLRAEEVFLGGGRVARGDRVLPDPRRARGANPNLLSFRSTESFDLPLVDTLGGIPDFSLTKVRVEKVSTEGKDA